MKTSTASAILLLCATALATPAWAQNPPDVVQEGEEQFGMQVLVEGLAGPWEVTYGPDDHLWVTERTAGRVTRVNPTDGTATPAITIAEVLAPGGQDGLLGMALHPQLLQGTGNDYVYVAYTYADEEKGADPSVTDPASPYVNLYAKIVRLTYNQAEGTLGEPTDLIAGLPASNDHNSGRLKFGPDGKLYYTIGDQGNNQLANVCIPIEAQRLPTADEIGAEDYVAYVGKSLRLNPDGSVPEDNPELEGVRSHVYTYGHRNMQGIDFAPDGTLYASEQGPKTDDEVNVLQPGGNYGWPHVAGFRDDMAYQYARWAEAETPCEQLEFSDIEIHESVPREDETAWTEDFVEPLLTMFTVPSDYDFTDPECRGMDFICWPTVAASSIDYYDSEGIPEWNNSLLVTTLKRGSLYRIPLAEGGQAIEGPIYRYFQSENRFRDTALSPDGTTIYVATDPGGLAEALEGGVTREMQNPGAILVFTHGAEAAGATATPPAEEPGAGQQPAAEGDQGASEEPAGEEGATQGGAAGQDQQGGNTEGAASTSDSTGASGEATPASDAAGQPPVFTADQAGRGRTSYTSNCAVCHGSNLMNGTMAPPLAGPSFAADWGGRSVWELYQYAHDNMPPSRPASLPDQTYADIVAYILQTNGVEPGDAELVPDEGQLSQQVITIEAAE